MEPSRQSSVVNGQSIDYSNADVKGVVSKQALEIKEIMFQALVVACKEEKTYKQFFEKHLNVRLILQLAYTDEKVQTAFNNLFCETAETIKKDKALFNALKHIDDQAGGLQASEKFIGSFVFPAVDPMLKILDSINSNS